MFNYIQVNSSNLEAIAINGKNLIIKFKSGGIYEYFGAAREFSKLLIASSKGKYFNEFIKNNYGKPKKIK